MKARILAGLVCAVLIFAGCDDKSEQKLDANATQTQTQTAEKNASMENKTIAKADENVSGAKEEEKTGKFKLADGKDAKDITILRSASDVLDEDEVKLIDINWTLPAAGEAQRYERAFENAPPMIPHDLEGLVPITTDNNMCISCHMPEVAEGIGATSIPKSHFYSIRYKKDTEGELSQDRFVCTVCHAPQANIEPKFKNDFVPEYRDANSTERSNLLDVLNEGVR